MYKYRLWITISALALIIAIGLVYITVNDIPGLNDSISICEAKIVLLEDKLEEKDFAYTCADMEIDNLEQIIESKDGLILELRVKEEMNVLYKEMLQYCVVYIQYLQIDMADSGMDYPNFIIDSVLTDEFFDELQEQEEYFEEME